MNVQRILSHYRSSALEQAHLNGPLLNGKSVCVQGPANSYTGYGLHTSAIVRSLSASGYRIKMKPLGPVEVNLPVEQVEVCSFPSLAVQPLSSPPSSKVDFWFTMHESTRIPDWLFNGLGMARQLIVPSAWNAACFSAQGCEQPIHVCPLGVDTNCFSPGEPADICTFGVAGNPTLSGAVRKNLHMALRAFALAFPDERDVRLKVKVLPGTELNSDDARVEIVRDIWTEAQMADWTRKLTAFVLPSKAEAWSLLSLQALACGCPVIAAPFAGLTDYFSADVGYPVRYRLTHANDELYSGLWAEPSLDSMVEQMRLVYEDRNDAAERGRRGRQRAESYTWDAAGEILEGLLIGAVEEKTAPRLKRVAPVKTERVFYHSGNMGDIVYGLCSIKLAGGGKLLVGPKQCGTSPLETPTTKEQFEYMLPLLKQQNYLRSAAFVDDYPAGAVTCDLNTFRNLWTNGSFRERSGIHTLVKMQCLMAGVLALFREQEPWLTVSEHVRDNRIVVHRSPRYNSNDFPWQELVNHYGSEMLFVGIESEFEAFVENFGPIKYQPTSDALEMARIIAGAACFVGNQSFPCSIALGLGQRVLQESWSPSPDCVFKRDGRFLNQNDGLDAFAQWLC